MKTTVFVFAVLVGCLLEQARATEPTQDLRVELPRDLRIALLGVPSIKNAQSAEESLKQALQQYEDELANGPRDETQSGQAKIRLCFRLGKFDESLAALLRSLRDQERIKGLEEYRELARELDRLSESLAGFCGDSPAPVVQEDAEPASSKIGSSVVVDPAKQLRADVARIDDVLRKIEMKAKPDEERKAQLEKEVGEVGQFVAQMKRLADAAAAGSDAGQKELQIDTNEMIRGVQGLIDVIRDLKQQREERTLRVPREPKESKELKKSKRRETSQPPVH